MNAPATQSQTRAIGSFILVTLIWGSTWLVIKDQVSAVPAAWSVVWRFILASAAIMALAGLRGIRLRLERREHLLAAAIGLFQFCVNFQLIYQAERYLTSGLVAVMFGLMILPNALLARAVLGTPVGVRFLAGSGIALCGIALLLLHEYRIAALDHGVVIGGALVALAILSVAVGNLLQATSTARSIPVLGLMAWSMVWGTGFNFAFAAAFVGVPQFDPRPAYLGGIGYLALIGSVLTFPLYSQLIREWGPGKAAYNAVAVPVVAMVLSTLFEGYRWSFLAEAGGLLAIVGLLIALSGRK